MTTGYGQRFDGRIGENHMIKGQVVDYRAYAFDMAKVGLITRQYSSA
jgi:hypothetical protein